MFVYCRLVSVLPCCPGLMNSSNVTLNDDISGVLGLGFPRLSTISSLVNNGAYRLNILQPSTLKIV